MINFSFGRRSSAATFGRIFFIICVLALLSSLGNSQTFRYPNPRMIVTALDPAAVVSGDWNGDGHQDLIYIDKSANTTLHVLLGDGQGGLRESAAVQLPAGTCYNYSGAGCWIEAGDFNGDGKNDLLIPGQSSSYVPYFVVLPGRGDGTFADPIVSSFQLPTGDTFNSHQVAVADFNGDGLPDIAVPSYYTERTTLYINNGNGSFSTGVALDTYYDPYSAFAADVNHDGKPDLIVFVGRGGYYTHGIQVWLGDGKGNFSHAQNYPTDLTAVAPVTVADLNRDGNVDVIVHDQSGNLQVMTGNQDGSFNPPTTVITGKTLEYTMITVADLNGDGVPDLLNGESAGLDVTIGSSLLSFGPPQLQSFGPLSTRIVSADFNEDGVPDAAVGVTGGIQILFGNRQGAFPDSTVHRVNDPLTFLFAGDFNKDGVSDVVAVTSSGFVQTYPGIKGGGFGSPIQSATVVTSGFWYVGNLVGDFDGDGKRDIFVAGGPFAPAQTLYGNGDGTFVPVSGGYLTNGLVADLNKDGKSDVVGISEFGTGGTDYGLTTLLGGSSRSFTQVVTNFPDLGGVSSITTPVLLSMGDFNGDGFADAALYNPNTPALEIWLGNGDGSFKLGSKNNINLKGLSVPGTGGLFKFVSKGASADFDGDGNLDLASLAYFSETSSSQPANPATPTYVLLIEYGDGAGHFVADQVIALTHNYDSLTLARLDATGKQSLVLGDGSLIATIRNLGDRLYSPEELYTAGSFFNVLTGDFDGDGFSDILVNRPNPNYIPAASNTEFTVLMSRASDSAALQGALTLSSSTLAYDQGFTLTTTLSPSRTGDPVPTGNVTFIVSGIVLGTVPVQAGVAILDVPGSVTKTLPAGRLLAVAHYSGNANYGPMQLAAALTVLEPVYATQISLAVELNGQPITSIQAGSFIKLHVTVTAAEVVPRGYVTFYDGTSEVGHAELSNGHASLGTNLLGIGAHSFVARYQGFNPQSAASYLPSSSSAVPFMVFGVETSASLAASNQVLTAGTLLTLTATVTSTSGAPIGGVTFFDSATPMGTMPLGVGGTAAFSTASLSTGKHTFTAQYAANGMFAGSATQSVSVTVAPPSTAQLQTFVVLSKVLPLNGSAGTQVQAQVLTQTGLPAALTGRVSLVVDGRLSTSRPLSAGGQVLLPIEISDAGVHEVHASYSGNTDAAPSVSDTFRTTVYNNGQDFVIRPGQSSRMRSIISIPLTVESTGGSSGVVSMRCASGVPAGYYCDLSPSTLTGSGTAVVTLRPTAAPLSAFALLLPCVLFLSSNRRFRLIATLVIAIALLCLWGCGVSRTAERSSIVTIEATSGALTHATQVLVKTNAGDSK